MSYNIYLFHPEVKTKSLQDRLPLNKFEHPKLSTEQISYFITRLKPYEYQENDVPNKIAEYEKYFGKCVVTVSIYDTEIAFSVPYLKDSDRAIFEALMTASEINDTGKFALYNPQDGTWDED